MKEIKLVRVDDRLIHAQIIIFWLKKININTIYIIDDRLAKNEFLCQIYRLTTPPYIRLRIFTVDQAIQHINNKKMIPSTSRILVLIKELSTVTKLHQLGFPIDTVQIGGGLLEGGFSKKQIIEILFSKYRNDLNYLFDNNIQIYCQNTTDSEKIIITKDQDNSISTEQQDFQVN